MAKSSLRVKSDNVPDLHAVMQRLTQREVLVGFPEENTVRESGELSEPTNASLGYIHDNGAPEANIPARPFMLPALESVRDQMAEGLAAGARGMLRRQSLEELEKGLHRVGFIAEVAIKTKINEGIPPPLANSTLRARASRGREGAMWELAWRQAGAPAGTELAKPLIDTGQMRNAVKYVIRDRKQRKL